MAAKPAASPETRFVRPGFVRETRGRGFTEKFSTKNHEKTTCILEDAFGEVRAGFGPLSRTPRQVSRKNVRSRRHANL
jgi:hypothetical protein